MLTCCAHGAEVHDTHGCAAWLGYYEPGVVGYCPCKIGLKRDIEPWSGLDRRKLSIPVDVDRRQQPQARAANLVGATPGFD